jgi:hypothetical protein
MNEFTSSTILFLTPHSPILIPGVVSTSIIFTFTYMCTHFIALYSPSYLLSPTLYPSHWCQPSPLGRTCSTLLFSNFVRRKKKRKDKTKNMTFLLEIKEFPCNISICVL